MSIYHTSTTLNDNTHFSATKDILSSVVSEHNLKSNLDFCDRDVVRGGSSSSASHLDCTDEKSLEIGELVSLIKDQGHDDAVMVFNLSQLERMLEEWHRHLPNVKPFYAIKSNDDDHFVEMLGAKGTGFDCASKGEIIQALKVGKVAPEDIIFANPCKSKSYLEFAKSVGVKKMTFDCAHELDKIKEVYPEAEVILRVRVDDTGAICRLGLKFGAHLSVVDSLLQKCSELKLNLIGISFHVGSGQTNPNAFPDALAMVKGIFSEAKEKYGYNFNFLDIGGGFPGYDGDDANNRFGAIAANIRDILNEDFSHCSIIAEPGRYFCSSPCTLVTKVLSKKEMEVNGKRHFYYFINDGVYGCFNNTLYDHAEPKPNFLEDYPSDVVLYPTTIYGPTCDSIDVVLRDFPMPELEIDDFFFWENMGAYTIAASATFNGFPIARKMYIHKGMVL
jgi:ornithine decarboxylase